MMIYLSHQDIHQLGTFRNKHLFKIKNNKIADINIATQQTNVTK